MVAAHSSSGTGPPRESGCDAHASERECASARASAGTNGISASPKCALASRGSSEGKMSTPMIATPGPSRDLAPLSARASTSYM
eukprot:4086744-Pleurochrysis_carterae.AAC.6